tara:strand:- start:333 stop:983 length:651 start_codon:yes stop_codon:yes gene_type:complete
MTDIIPVEELDVVQDKIKNDHKEISQEQTPKHFIKKRPDGFDYVEEGYMRSRLNKRYPIWSWEAVDSGIEMIGAEWAIVTAELVVVDNGVPRKFFSPGAARIQFKRGATHTPENVIDIDKNLASANSNAFKRACNRLGNICDDVYRKQIEDISLSVDQIQSIESLIKNMDKDYQENVRSAIENGDLNTTNLNSAMDRLKETTERDDVVEGENSGNE